MKLAVISDVHGNLLALETVLADVDKAGVDKVWMLGDLAAHGPRPAECVALLRQRHEADKDNFQVIGGNTDRYIVTNARPKQKPAEDEAAYQKLMEQARVNDALFAWARERLGWENYEFLSKITGRELHLNVDDYGTVVGYHAAPGDDEQNITADSPAEEALDSVLDRPLRLGLYGHIHRQVNRDLGRVRLVNPGSVGLSFDQPGMAQYALLTFADGEVTVAMHNLPYDVAAVSADAAAVGHPGPDRLTKVLQEGM